MSSVVFENVRSTNMFAPLFTLATELMEH